MDKKITCRSRKCGKKFPIKVGVKNSQWTVKCPYCKKRNYLFKKENGKIVNKIKQYFLIED